MNKYDKWWNDLPPQMQEYLKKQPIWHDRDLLKATAVGIVIGIFVGLCLGYSLALPDHSKRPITYLKG